MSITHAADENPRGLTESEWAIEERFITLESQLNEIRETLEFIKATIVKADATITGVAEQVMPTVNDLMKSPLLKMLGMKK